jgi:hypothetical protein
MNETEQAILSALTNPEDSNQVNHAYFKFLKSQVYLPCEPNGDPNDPRVLFLEEEEQIFLPVFSEEDYLKEWAGEDQDKIASFMVTGVELILGLGEKVTLAYNPGQSSYKEFNPEEIIKLKTMVAKIKSLVENIDQGT